MKRPLLFSLVGLGLGLVACGSPRRELSDSHTPASVAAVRTSSATEMPVSDARRVLVGVGLESAGPAAPAASFDDALAALRSDEVAQFPRALSFAKSQNGKRAKALAAQVEIAWGENLRIVANMLDRLGADLRDERRELDDLDALGKLTAEERARAATLRKLVDEKEPLIAAMSRMAPVHLAEGRAMAEALVKEVPDSYEGYRVLADYYRIRGEWDRYDAMVKEVEQRYPQSTGLLFLKGISLADRQGDADGAAKLLADALKADPKFSRARVQLMFLAKGLTAKREEFLKLRAESPNHQLVAVVGPVIDAVWESRERRRLRTQRYDWRVSDNGGPTR